MSLAGPILSWIAGMLGVVWTQNYYFPWFLYAIVQFVIVWATSGIHLAPVEDRYTFVVRETMHFGQGTLAGLALVWGLGSRPLVPTQFVDKFRPTLGTVILSITSVFSLRALLIATGVYEQYTVFWPGHASSGTYWAAFAVFLAVALFVLIISWIGTELPVLRWFRMSYPKDEGYADEADTLIPDLSIALALLILPYLFWVFLSNLVGGIVSIVVQLAVWVAIFLYFKYARSVESSLFSEKSASNWLMFCLVNALASLIPGVAYLIVSETGADFNTLSTVTGWIMAGYFLAALVLRYIVLRKQFPETMQTNSRYSVLDEMVSRA